MAKTTTQLGNVQTTFTKQKRELAKAHELIESLRAQEVRIQRFSPDDKLVAEERKTWVNATPQEIAAKVFAIVKEVVAQHGARQQGNSVNTGTFEFCGVTAQLTAPQLRALQDITSVLRELVEELPVENKRFVANGEIEGRPAFFKLMTPVVETKTRYVPFEEQESTRVRTYEEKYEEVLYKTREVTIDYGLPVERVEALKTLVGDLGVAIQVAIDDANAKPRKDDPALNDVIGKIVAIFDDTLQGNPQKKETNVL